MRPHGHLAGGVLVGTFLARRTGLPAGATIAASALAANLPDIDLLLPPALDFAGIRHDLKQYEHHSWPSHTPLGWTVVLAAATAGARHPRVPSTVRSLVCIARAGVALHIAQDATANSVALAWPLTKTEYGLRLDGCDQPATPRQYLKLYKGSRAHRLEQVLAVAALAAVIVELHRGS